MVESVDTKDLKSFGYCSCAGSSPAPGTNKALQAFRLAMLLLFTPDKLIISIVNYGAVAD